MCGSCECVEGKRCGGVVNMLKGSCVCGSCECVVGKVCKCRDCVEG